MGDPIKLNGDPLLGRDPGVEKHCSNESQNEFIAECSDLVQQHILGERQSTKYYAIIVGSTPDSSRVEQITLILRYLVLHESRFKIVKRFLKFVNCSDKRGCRIA